ncbi:MAG: HAD-IIB family hydrolase [Candidatus Aminicenantes bacterium]|nr:HAD-IIB family hydrolase [Candidatus Aminicenantes bacterium]
MSFQLIVFTDLDATLLDFQTYSFQAARPMLKKLRRLGIPIILNTSKTRAETEIVSKRLRLNHPFIVENGGAIFIPEGYFPPFFGVLGMQTKKRDKYRVVQLGTPYQKLRKYLEVIRKKTMVNLVGFGDLTTEQIAYFAGLKRREAALARLREYDEPFLVEADTLYAEVPFYKGKKDLEKKGKKPWAFNLNKEQEVKSFSLQGQKSVLARGLKKILSEIKKEAKRYGLKIIEGGRFYHLTGNNDKGRAVRLLRKLYRLKYGRIITIGLGDSANDWPMLKAVDYPVLVARPDGSHANLPSGVKNVYKTRQPGPEGWAEALEYFLSRFQVEKKPG